MINISFLVDVSADCRGSCFHRLVAVVFTLKIDDVMLWTVFGLSLIANLIDLSLTAEKI